MEGPIKQTTSPILTGTSIVGIVFDGGVVLGGDLLGSYGSMAQMRHLPRIFKVNDVAVMGASGDYADFQFLNEIIQEKVNQDYCLNDGYMYKPKALFSWCTRVLYNRRSNMDPLWNRIVIGGMQDGQPFLGSVDLLGKAYEAPCIATGYGSYLAIPILRDFMEKNPRITEAQAIDMVERSLRVLYYRDARAYDKYSLAIVTKDGSRIESPKELKTNWSIASGIANYE